MIPLVSSKTLLLLGPMLLLGIASEVVAQSRDGFVLLADSNVPKAIESREVILEPVVRRRVAPVITALAASSDGKFLAAAGDDHAIRIVNPETGKVIRTLQGHRDWIQSLAFAANSQTLYSAANDGQVLKWSLNSDRFERVISLPFALRTISIATTKQLLAIGGFHHEIILFDLASNQIVRRLHCGTKDQRCVRFSPDGTQILSGGRDGDLNVWQTSTGKRVANFHEHSGRIYTAAFNVAGDRVTSAGEDRRLVQYNLKDNSVHLRRELAPTKLKSMCMINNDLVAVAGADNSIHLYDAIADEVTAHLEAHEGTVAVMTPCGEQLVSGSFDTTIRIWNLASIDTPPAESSKPVSHAPMTIDADLRIK